MLLIHDLVEIDAGDTYAYDEAGKATQREREVKAADRIFSILPEEQGKALRALWEEFEARETPEAKFARTMDNIQPLMKKKILVLLPADSLSFHLNDILCGHLISSIFDHSILNFYQSGCHLLFNLTSRPFGMIG